MNARLTFWFLLLLLSSAGQRAQAQELVVKRAVFEDRSSLKSPAQIKQM
jgi:hypothetical protein